MHELLRLSPEVAAARHENRPIVALESTLITFGLPWPANAETALAMERAVRECGAVPATIAVLGGQITVGLSPDQIDDLAQRATGLGAEVQQPRPPDCGWTRRGVRRRPSPRR